MFSGLMTLMGAIPVIGTIVTNITGAFFNAKVNIMTARLGVTRDVAVEMLRTAAIEQHEANTRLSTIAGSKLLTYLIVAFAVPIVLYEFQVVVIDTIIMEGWLGIEANTHPIKGQVADWMNTIITCLFGASTVLGVGQLAVKAIEKVK